MTNAILLGLLFGVWFGVLLKVLIPLFFEIVTTIIVYIYVVVKYKILRFPIPEQEKSRSEIILEMLNKEFIKKAKENLDVKT
jgi:hypothetical protein